MGLLIFNYRILENVQFQERALYLRSLTKFLLGTYGNTVLHWKLNKCNTTLLLNNILWCSHILTVYERETVWFGPESNIKSKLIPFLGTS